MTYFRITVSDSGAIYYPPDGLLQDMKKFGDKILDRTSILVLPLIFYAIDGTDHIVSQITPMTSL
jgi:hypothetical protein